MANEEADAQKRRKPFMKILWLLVSVLLCLFVSPYIQAGSFPSSEGRPDITLLEQLSEDYERYGLPLPPTSTTLAYIEPLGPPRSRPKEPEDRILALVEQSGEEKQKVRWYGGFRSETVDEEEVVVPVEPEQATLKRTRAGHAGPRFIGDSDLCMAVFCHRRGWTALGLEFLKRKLQHEREDIREGFARSAWRYWEEVLVAPDTDRNVASRYLKLLASDHPSLQREHHKNLLSDLDFTLNASSEKREGIEGEIEALRNTALANGWSTQSLHEFEEKPAVLRSLWLRGFEAVPFLLQHLEDRRLARAQMIGLDRYPIHVMRVAEMVSRLLFALAGEGKIAGRGHLTGELELADRASAEQWWERAKAMGEERYLLANILPEKDSEQAWPNSHNAAILAHKYPEKLPGLYETLLTRYPQAERGDLADLLARSKAPQAEKERLLIRTTTTGVTDQHISGYWALIEMKSPKALALLIARMESLPSKPKEAYWLGEAGALALMVQKLDDPRGWAALERLAHRSVVGQRLQILGDLHNVQATGTRKRHRIQFMSRFLDDNTLCDFSQDKEAFDGPHAHFDLEKITVRDGVLRDLAYQVGVSRYPRSDWKPEDWDAWRPTVLTALRRYLSEMPDKNDR
jgi:hypothetical protein